MSELKEGVERSKEGYKKDEEEFLGSIKKMDDEWAKIGELPDRSESVNFHANSEPSEFLPEKEDEINLISNTDPEDFGIESPEHQELWMPEDFDFQPASSARFFFEKRNFELVPKQHNYWLCRKKIRNAKGNTEYLVKFFVKILPTDIEFARIMLTKALE
jgi:hypothetical protein